METEIKGPAGIAQHVPSDHPAITGSPTVTSWLLTLPGQSLGWSQYALSIVHLRPSPNYPPAELDYPEAEYEVILFALTPEPFINDPMEVDHFNYLTPLNFVYQFHGLNDEQVVKLGELLVKGMVNNVLMAEPGDFLGGVHYWIDSIQLSVEHMIHGGHQHGAAS